MKIVQINGGAKGSTGKIMFGIADVARNAGHEVLCVSPITSTNKFDKVDDKYYVIGTYFTRKINVALSKISGYNGCFSYFSTYKFLKKLNQFKPDILHLHNLHDSYINLPMLFNYIKKYSIPVVWTFHDCWPFTGQCPYFTLANCYKWQEGCQNCDQFRGYPSSIYDNTRIMWKLKRKWFNGVENMVVVTPSQWLANLVSSSFLKSYPIKVINNGIDLSIFRPNINLNYIKSIQGLNSNKYTILGIAYEWSYRKGLDIFIKLFSSIDTDQYQIVLVGTNDEIDKKLPNGIISIHRTNNQEELSQLYSLADVFVIPTREDNFPTVNLEAIACGTPVVTFDVGGSPEMLNIFNGRVVPVDDIETLIFEIKFCCENLKINNDKIIESSKNFDMNYAFDKYIQLYSEVLGKESYVEK